MDQSLSFITEKVYFIYSIFVISFTTIVARKIHLQTFKSNLQSILMKTKLKLYHASEIKFSVSFKLYIPKALILYFTCLFKFVLLLEAIFTNGITCLSNCDLNNLITFEYVSNICFCLIGEHIFLI